MRSRDRRGRRCCARPRRLRVIGGRRRARGSSRATPGAASPRWSDHRPPRSQADPGPPRLGPAAAPPTVPGATSRSAVAARSRASPWSRLLGHRRPGAHPRHRRRAVAQPAAHPLAGGRLGTGAAGALRDLRAAGARGPGAVPLAGRVSSPASCSYSYVGSAVRVRRAGQAALEPRRGLRLPDPAGDHLRLARCSPSCTTSASCSSWCAPSRVS